MGVKIKMSFSQEIINELDNICENENKNLKDFLLEIFLEEFDHPGNWHWKDFYNKKIEEYSRNMGE